MIIIHHSIKKYNKVIIIVNVTMKIVWYALPDTFQQILHF